MDANNTRYHLLLTREDWAACTDDGTLLSELWTPPADPDAVPDPNAPTPHFAWNDKRDELTLAPLVFQFTTSAYDRKPLLEDRRGAGRDRFGNTYWIDATKHTILVNSSGSGTTGLFWSTDSAPPPPDEFGAFNVKDPVPPLTGAELSGLTVTDDHYLVVGVIAPAGLLIFDLHAGGPPQQVVFPSTIPFVPFDMAAIPGGGVWVLDRANTRYWALDRYFNVISNQQDQQVIREAGLATFQPINGPELRYGQRLFPLGLSLDAAAPLDIEFPVAIEALPDGTVLILECHPPDTIGGPHFSRVYRYRYGVRLGDGVSTEAIIRHVDPVKQADFRLLGHDFAFVPDDDDKNAAKILGTLFVVGEDGNQAFAFHVLDPIEGGGWTLDSLPTYYPMRLFGGKGLFASSGSVYYDFENRWLMLIDQRRPRYLTEGTLLTPLNETQPAPFKAHPPLDGQAPGCVWHRVLLDGCIPPEAEVIVWSRATDELADLPYAAWQREPRLYQRGDGSELPYVETRYETWELLLQRAKGRYLQLRLELRGDGRHTPNLRALRVYYPRFSYMQYLPGVYREDREAAAFLDRFLANLEGFFTAIEDKIAAVQMLFDVRSTPQETLDWLAGWFGVAFDAAWDAERRRLFIKHAMTFFNRRGTIPGLLMALQLVLEKCPDDAIFDMQGGTWEKRANASGIRIIERFRTRQTPSVLLGDPTEIEGLSLVPLSERWQPAQGGAILHKLYQDTREDAGLSRVPYPLAAPSDENEAALWHTFSQQTLGFVPSSTRSAALWRDFLARRYRDLRTLNDAYRRTGTGTEWTDFSAAVYPTALPDDGSPLYDWFQFESIVLPMHAAAHHFTVLLPVPSNLTHDIAGQQDRMAFAQRVIELEKPAHTVFDIKFYWAMFRVGGVRLGYDTIIDQGSRAAELLSPLILGQAHVMESYLAPSHPQDVRDRQVLGRDRLTGDA